MITPYRNGTDPYAARPAPRDRHRRGRPARPVVAAAGGEVRFAGTAGSSGLTVSVRTADGFDTSYLHLSSLAVRAGARVSAGERVGAVGTTGTRSAVAPHLHFGVRDAGTRHAYLDPLSILPPATAPPPSEAPRPVPAPAPAPLSPSQRPYLSPPRARRAAVAWRPLPRGVPRAGPPVPRPAPVPRSAPGRRRSRTRPARRPAPRARAAPRACPAARARPTGPARPPRRTRLALNPSTRARGPIAAGIEGGASTGASTLARGSLRWPLHPIAAPLPPGPPARTSAGRSPVRASSSPRESSASRRTGATPPRAGAPALRGALRPLLGRR